MRLLLDTHALLWFVLDDPRLSAPARAAIREPGNGILVSPASYWEIAIKVALGKYRLAGPFAEFMERAIAGNDFEVLAITPAHAAGLIGLASHHRDPFDRMLIAQGIVDRLPIISADVIFDAYPVSRVW